jgi:hypothetical protein
MPRHLLSLLPFVLLTFSLEARVLSYAPLSDKQAVPAVQERTNRYFALIEFSFAPPPVAILLPPGFGFTGFQLVLYDSTGEHEPRVILPKEGTTTNYIGGTAVWESATGVPHILTHTDYSLNGDNPERRIRFLYSADGGVTWKAVLTGNPPYAQTLPDIGGPVARARGAWLRPGTAEYPFTLLVGRQSGSPGMELVAIAADGTPRTLGYFGPLTGGSPSGSTPRFIGTDREGGRFLVLGSVLLPDQRLGDAVRVVNLSGELEEVLPLPSGDPGLEGWITPDGTVYLLSRGFGGPRTLLTYRNGQRLDSIALNADSFAAPTHDFSGAWIVQRGTGLPTVLLRHSPGSAALEMWRDPSGPEVEAIHAARSGERLLIQVHRPRPQLDTRLFIDPALAIWEIGDPAPASYDELFLNEGPLKGFVSLDVDEVANGGSFVFDSAMSGSGGPVIPISPAPPGGGGGDVTQEWGVVRASLRQRLVIPSVARTEGAYGSQWRTDVVLHNPSTAPLSVELRFVRTGLDAAHMQTRSVQLNGRETRLIRDVVLSLFGATDAAGALFLDPEFGTAITATSRTYSQTPTGGTFGMGMPALDLHASASSRFAQTFAGAIQGTDFRTNVLVTDVSGRGSEVRFQARPAAETAGEFILNMQAPRGGQMQVNDISRWIQLPFTEAGALAFRPSSGEAIASVVAIDNRTNDPSYFPPDLPAQSGRVIPAIAHAPGAFGSQFRSDLFIFNPTASPASVTLAAKRWDLPENESMVNLTLKAGEVRVIRDAFFTLFGKTGVGRLRYASWAGGSEVSVRVTSRLYTVDANGATFGLVMPPINSFQSAGEMEAVEILGVRGGSQFRTNLALVELSPFAAPGGPANVHVHVYGPAGDLLDSFPYSVPRAGGVQILDIFRSRGLGDGPDVALIRVDVSSGRVAAFASNLDNITNDSTYLSAVLASQEGN